jgi:hypothetical protein
MITDTPDWMKNNAPSDGKDSMAGNDLELSPVDDTEPAAAAANDASASSDRPSDQGGNACKCLKYLNWFISLCLLVLFIASAAYQDNDTSQKILWILFYAFNAATVCLFVVAKSCPQTLQASSEKLLSAWGLAMIAWGIGMLVWTTIDFVQTDNDGSEGQDSDNLDAYTEAAFEFGGAGFGLLSSIYHFVVWKCCCKQPKRDD